MAAWEFPRLNPEQKLLLTDDVAGLVVDFGFLLVERAIDWHRQHAESRRPAIGKIREYCESHKPARKRSDADVEHEAFLRDIQIHPERYTPVSLILSATVEVTKQRQREGFDEAEAKRRIESIVEKGRMQWLAELKKQPKSDRKTVAAGA